LNTFLERKKKLEGEEKIHQKRPSGAAGVNRLVKYDTTCIRGCDDFCCYTAARSRFLKIKVGLHLPIWVVAIEDLLLRLGNVNYPMG
jgi:hypothetical protein